MAIELIDKIKQKNGGTFKLVDSEDVAYGDSSVEEEIKNISKKIQEVASTGTTTEVLQATTENYIQEKISDGTIANLTIEDDSITEEKLKCTLITENSFGKFDANRTHSWSGFSKTINSDNSVTIAHSNDQSDTSMLLLSHELDMNLESNHRYYVAIDVRLDNNTTYDSLLFRSIDFTREPIVTVNAISKGTEQRDATISKNERKNIKFILTTGEVSDVTTKYILIINDVEPGNTVSYTLYNIFITDMGSVENDINESYELADEIFNTHGYDSGRRIFEAEVRSAVTASVAEELNGFDKNDYLKKTDIPVENAVLFENKLNFNVDNIVAWAGYNPNKNNINFTNNTGETNMISISYLTDFLFEVGHKYFIAVDLTLLECTQLITGDTTTGNLDFDNLLLSGTTNLDLITSSVIKRDSIITVGNRKSLKFEFEINEQANNYSTHYIRFIPMHLNVGETINMTIHNICVVDMGDKNYSDINLLFNKYGYLTKTENFYDISVAKSKTSEVADVANSVKNISSSTDIELWGDSLVGQMYGDIIAKKLGRTVLSYGYGGKKSAYIRDKFLELSNKDNTIIINVGTNDSVNYDDILDVDNTITNIRMMVNAIPHNRFLICTPPNGGYGRPASLNGGVADGDFKGGTKHKMLVELERRLSLEYQGHYLNTREACIYGYDMGGVKLLKSFIQPQVGDRVQISVSDSTFLTTYNQNDFDDYGEDFMKQIRIGSLSKADLYKVISKDSDTLITVELVEVNRITPGGVVENGVDNGGTDSTMYLKVVQEVDYQCFIGDTTASTFRKDKIHMSDRGMEELSTHVSRAIARNCI